MATLEYARGRSWYVEVSKPKGGFCFINENSISCAWRHLRAGDITLRDFRAWLACHEMAARRCTLEDGRKPRFAAEELHGLIGGSGGASLRRSVRRLSRFGLLRFDEDLIDAMPSEVADDPGRPVPMPRRALRMLAKSSGRAFIAATLGHLIRCLFYRRGTCRSGGWCKASWVAEVFGVAVRAVKDARSRLAKLGLIRFLAADQLRLNRFGKPLVICMEWSDSARPECDPDTRSAPPREHKELSLRRADHQEPARAADPDGARTNAKTPALGHVTTTDLEEPLRLASLFKQARLRGWVRKCEADILNVFAAACHATRVGSTNPPGLFAWMLRHQKWQFISVEDEDRGRGLLRRLRRRARRRAPEPHADDRNRSATACGA